MVMWSKSEFDELKNSDKIRKFATILAKKKKRKRKRKKKKKQYHHFENIWGEAACIQWLSSVNGLCTETVFFFLRDCI